MARPLFGHAPCWEADVDWERRIFAQCWNDGLWPIGEYRVLEKPSWFADMLIRFQANAYCIAENPKRFSLFPTPNGYYEHGMRAADRMELLEKVGTELQRRYTFTDIDAFFAASNISTSNIDGRVPARGVGFEGSEADRTRAHR